MEQYKRNWKNYYEILQVSPNAEPEVIKAAFGRLANKYHPDTTKGEKGSVRMVKLNEAYEVLSNPSRKAEYDSEFKRRQYDANRFVSPEVEVDLGKTKTEGKPRPGVYPKAIRFDKVVPYVKQKGTFFIRNSGGSCRKVLISSPPEWIRVVKTASLKDHSKLPMQVDIEAIGIQWGKTYSAEVIVRLDESETRVKVILRTAKKSH